MYSRRLGQLRNTIYIQILSKILVKAISELPIINNMAFDRWKFAELK